MAPRTLYDRIWDDHLVHEAEDGTALIYIDRHLVHEVTSPQAFEGLRLAGRTVRAPDKTLAVVDHNVPTTDRSHGIDDPESALQVETLAHNAADFGIDYFSETDRARASSTSSGPSRASPCPAPPSCAATATPRPTAPSGRWPMASAPRRSSMCSPPRR
jgi:3-isopropylmalate/(R)-2-methylmalate dehydratase large subunit